MSGHNNSELSEAWEIYALSDTMYSMRIYRDSRTEDDSLITFIYKSLQKDNIQEKVQYARRRACLSIFTRGHGDCAVAECNDELRRDVSGHIRHEDVQQMIEHLEDAQHVKRGGGRPLVADDAPRHGD